MQSTDSPRAGWSAHREARMSKVLRVVKRAGRIALWQQMSLTGCLSSLTPEALTARLPSRPLVSRIDCFLPLARLAVTSKHVSSAVAPGHSASKTCATAVPGHLENNS
jgi:hypothetical protein